MTLLFLLSAAFTYNFVLVPRRGRCPTADISGDFFTSHFVLTRLSLESITPWYWNSRPPGSHLAAVVYSGRTIASTQPDSIEVPAAQAIVVLNSRYPEAINDILSLLLNQLRAFGAQHKFLFWPSPISSLLFSLFSLQLLSCIFVDTKISTAPPIFKLPLQASGKHMRLSSHNAHRNTDALQQIREQPRGLGAISVSSHLPSTPSTSPSNFLLSLTPRIPAYPRSTPNLSF